LSYCFSASLPLFTASNSSSFALSTVNDQVCKSATSHDRNTKIPNLVHYVWIVKDPTTFGLDFKFFITAYSAHLYFHPDKIYIHTGASCDVFEHAKSSGDDWTRWILGLPNIEYHQVDALSKTKKGVPISKFEHETDFVRMDALLGYGGIYLDTDAVPLRDISDLRNRGFAKSSVAQLRSQ
jgi:mannosyltransferase OCH1-like enzyme